MKYILILFILCLRSICFGQEQKHLNELLGRYTTAVNGDEKLKSSLLAYEIALQYESFHSDEQALYYYEIVVELAQNNQEELFYAFSRSGKILFKKAAYKKSRDFFERAIALAKEKGNKEDYIFSIIDLGLSYFKLKKYKKSIHFLEQSAKISESFELYDLVLHAYDLLIQVAKKSHKNKKLIVYQEQYNFYDHLLSEKINLEVSEKVNLAEYKRKQTEKLLHQKNEELISQSWDFFNQKEELNQISDSLSYAKELTKLQETELKLIKIKDRLHLVELKEVKAEKSFQRLVISVIASFALFLTGLSFFIYKNLKIHKKARLQIERKNQAISRQNVLIADQKKEIEIDHEKIKSSISYAQRIQESALPISAEFSEFFPKSFVFYQPRDLVSGDFYWVHSIRGTDEVLLATIDCTGHGVPGAFMTMIAFNLLNRIVFDEVFSPDEILMKLHLEVQKALKQEKTKNQDGMDMTLLSWDKSSKVLKYAGAKNPLLIIKNQEMEIVKASKCSIGGTRTISKVDFDLHEIQLNAGDRFFTYSDGVVDQFGGEHGRKFLSKRFRQLLLDSKNMRISEQGSHVKKVINAYMGARFAQIDDIVVIGVEA